VKRGPAPLVAKLLETASRAPDRDAVVCAGERLTYGALAAAVAEAANFLKESGVHAGDRVILTASGRDASFIRDYLACHRAGAIAVPIEPGASETTLDGIRKLTSPKLSLPPGLKMKGGASAPVSVDLGDPADILLTGGTTGRPKGVAQTHGNILAFARGRNAAVGASETDRLVLPLPLSHGFGLGRVRATIFTGGTLVLVDGFMFAGSILRALDEQRGNAFCCVPAGFASLFRLTGDELGDFKDTLRYVETATAVLTADSRDRLLRLLPRTRVFNSYGMTETTSSIAFIDLHSAPSKRESVGKPIPGVRIRLVDGRIWVRGKSVMKCYWKDAARTRRTLAGGWCATNDAGLIDEDGYLYLKGRVDDLINVGGLKVAPLEIENTLRAHPAVRDCACLGTADPAGVSGEAIKAFLVPAGADRPSRDELAGWLRGKLEAYKIPAVVVWVEALPRTRVGKIRKADLRDAI